MYDRTLTYGFDVEGLLDDIQRDGVLHTIENGAIDSPYALALLRGIIYFYECVLHEDSEVIKQEVCEVIIDLYPEAHIRTIIFYPKYAPSYRLYLDATYELNTIGTIIYRHYIQDAEHLDIYDSENLDIYEFWGNLDWDGFTQGEITTVYKKYLRCGGIEMRDE